MADGTIRGLRAGLAQTYWDKSRSEPYGALSYSSVTSQWTLGTFPLREDANETTPIKVVLRGKLRDGDEVKIIIPQAEGALTPLAIEQGIVHIYVGRPGELEFQGSLFIFKGGQ